MYAIIAGITWQIQKYRNVEIGQHITWQIQVHSAIDIGQDVLLLYHDPH